MPERRALCIGVSAFGDGAWLELPGAAERAEGLRTVLARLGYRCRVLTGRRTTSRAIGDAFYEVIEGLGSDDLLVVTVLSHGDLAVESGELYVVGADGARHRTARIGDWVKEAKDLAGRPRTLFLLDLCQAGTVARAPYLHVPGGGPPRSWVFAACPPDRPAYDGHFTQAVTNVLSAFADGERQIHADVPHLPLTTLGADVKRELGRLVAAADGHPQQAMGGLVDLIEAEQTPPFFPNPAYRLSDVRRDADAAFGAFLDEVDPLIDPAHYIGRASGHGRAEARLTSGCFTGRTAELRSLSRWLDGRPDGGTDRRADGALRVVTGSPGAGKSALLGMLVCAAHPRLRPHTERLWFRAAHTPSENDRLAAVHARQRGEEEILASVVRQLDLTGVDDWGRLPAALRRLPDTPVLIVDAVDEALRPVALADRLQALAGHVGESTAREPAGPACRLLVGLRPWEEFAGLLEAARSGTGLIDLDKSPRGEVRADIQGYVEAMLSLSAPYGSRPYAAARDAFASAVAETLSGQDIPNATGPRWGEFLVAALFVHRLLARRVPVKDRREAAGLGREAPCTLPGVLELELDEHPELRPVLQVLAAAHGEGMPLEAVRAVLPLFDSMGSCSEVPQALERARFYLRRAADVDGSVLYRLFHQSLADHLRVPHSDGAVLDRLLPAAWDGAIPYVLRHAVQYAAACGRCDELLRSPGFLPHADPRILESELSGTRADDTKLIATIYRSSAARHRDLDAAGRRQVLGIDAARHGAGDIAGSLTGGLPWRPRWATGGEVAAALRHTIQDAAGPVRALATAGLDGRAVVVAAAGDRPPKVWDPVTGVPLHARLGPSAATAVDCTRIGGRPVAVTGAPNGTVRVWDLRTGKQTGPVLTGSSHEIRAIACGHAAGRPFAVAVAANGAVFAWDLAAMVPVGVSPAGTVDCAVVCLERDGRPLVASPVDGLQVVVWDLLSGAEVARHSLTGAPHEIALGRVGVSGRQRVLAASDAGLWMLDETASRWLSVPRLQSPVVRGDSGAAVVGCGDGLVHLLRFDGSGSGECVATSLRHGFPVRAVGCVQLPDGVMGMVSGAADGGLRVWDPVGAPRTGLPRPAHLAPVRELAAARVRGQEVVLSRDRNRTVLLHGVRTGEQLSAPSARGALLAVWQRTDRPPLALFRDEYDHHRIQLWALWPGAGTATGRPLVAAAPVTAAAVMRFGSADVAVLGCGDGGLEIWNLRTRELRRRIPAAEAAPDQGADPVVALTPCPGMSDRGVLVSLSAAGQVRIRDLASPHRDGFPVASEPMATAIACARVHRLPMLLTGHRDGRLRRWDLSTGERGGPSLTVGDGPVAAIACGRAGGRHIAVAAAGDAAIRIWNLESRAPADTVALPGRSRSLAVSPDGSVIVAMNWEIVVFTSTPETDAETNSGENSSTFPTPGPA